MPRSRPDPTKQQRAAACYRRRLDALIDHLGGKCVECGEVERARLEIDHIHGRTWDVKAKSRWSRVARYWREAAEGLLQILCKSCNSSKGDPRPKAGERGGRAGGFVLELD